MTPFEKLTSIAEREYSALLVGDLEVLADIYFEKTELAIELEDMPPNAGQLKDLKLRLLRNQDLLDHTLAGIRAVTDRLGLMEQVSKSLSTYDESGRKKMISHDPALLEHRV